MLLVSIIPFFISCKTQNLLNLQLKAIHILQKIKALMHKEYVQKQEFGQSTQRRKLTVKPFFFEDTIDTILKLDQMQAPQPISPQTNTSAGMFDKSDKNTFTEYESKERGSHTTYSGSVNTNDIFDNDKYFTEKFPKSVKAKRNINLSGSINQIPFVPLPTYPPEVYINSEDVEFDFQAITLPTSKPITSRPVTSRPVTSRPVTSRPVTSRPVTSLPTSRQVTSTTTESFRKTSLVIKSTLELAKETSQRGQTYIENIEKNIPKHSFSPSTDIKAFSKEETESKMSKLVASSAPNVTVFSDHTDFHIRSETIEKGFIPVTRISKTFSGDWKGLLQSDLPQALWRTFNLKQQNAT